MPHWSRLSSLILFPSIFHATIPLSLESRIVSAKKSVKETLTQRARVLEERLRIDAGAHLHNGLFLTAIGKLADVKLWECPTCLSAVQKLEESKGLAVTQHCYDGNYEILVKIVQAQASKD